MSFRSNLTKARSSLIIIAALIVGSITVVTIENRLLKDRMNVSPAARQEAAAFAWAELQRADPARAARLRPVAEALGAPEAPPPARLSPEAAEALLVSLRAAR